MFGRFFYGQCSLSEAFWKFSVLGLTASGFVARLLMTMLKQTVNYEPRFLKVLLDNISLLSMNSSAFILLCFYIASVACVLVYAIVCLIGMWRTYREYEKSKILAFIGNIIVWGLIYLAVKYSIY